ncbi:class I SAM-dependent methyltransferase [Alkaliphilus serpentinus]|uniref:Methyltransferase domain-containing protein n=1 Tax=Alkaliphilus serpentinus TaxID=1482731 RepID=A0A833MD36_9FIRM|nr:class I SAM-dependent methyltransferase [Alkaliphilus serpentinus]KAB3527281.1 methyltransferase domain-containing protein [Alkaliphilus serpentinus]
MSSEILKRNERLEGVFNRVAASFDTIGPNYFSYFGEKLVDYSEIREGSTLLDVAFGRGASLFPAAKCVLEKGQVVGIDFSKEMVKETAALIGKLGISNIEVLQMDAEKLDFPNNQFDYVISGLSTSFFSNPLMALEEMYRVLKDGGRFGISTWKKRDKRGALDRAYTKVFPQKQEDALRKIPTRPDFGSIDGVEKILQNIGLKNIEIIVEEKRFYYKDEEEWWQEQWTNATRGLFEHVEGMGALDEFKNAAFIELMENKDVNGIRFDAEVIFGFGEK